MSDSSDIFGYVGGGAGIITFVGWLVKTLAGRVVEREDNDKKVIERKVEEREKNEREIRETLIGLKHDVSAMRAGQDQLSRQMETRAEAQDKEILSLRAEVKEQINQLEHRLRSDMQRLVSPGSAPRGRGRG